MTAPTTPTAPRRKLIEVSLPLEAINRESAREKSIRHGHPSTLHLWWARRPLAAARAVLFAQLVDDPSCDPRALAIEDEAEREEWVTEERLRLHRLIERMVVWENTGDEALFAEAHQEILRCTDGNPPPVLDPFAGGGSIPLEAQRLGLEAHASDLNPVAVLINKALIEIPPKFAGQPPVFPGAAEAKLTWPKATGLAEDVRRYGEWMRDRAKERIGHLYPDAVLPDGTTAPVIAWIWARTVLCTNPACGAEVPLVSSTTLSQKRGRAIGLRAEVRSGEVTFTATPLAQATPSNKTGQGAKFECWVCRSPLIAESLYRQIDEFPRRSHRLLSVVTEGERRRVYVDPTTDQIRAAAELATHVEKVRLTDDDLGATARGTFGGNAQGRRYGFKTFADYFTDRQLLTLTTFSDLIEEARLQARVDALAKNRAEDDCDSYADAIALYLGLAVSRLTDYQSSLTTWASNPQMEIVRNVFARQAIPMTWDFAESNPFAGRSGSLDVMIAAIGRVLDKSAAARAATCVQMNARDAVMSPGMISTDPPYYDNIGYADLADYFYVWLRRSLKGHYSETLSTLLSPKAEELVADAYRHGGKEGARRHFEQGFSEIMHQTRGMASADWPITLYYAFKQSEGDLLGKASTGWETLLLGILAADWSITATWPLRSERSGRMVSLRTNALASSIVLALRPRREDAPTTDRRGFLATLRQELPQALKELQQGAIAPVDLPQAAIGPGMAVFTRYAAVLDSDGSPMPIRAALAQINAMLDEVLTAQENNFDTDTRFAVQWFRQHGFAVGAYGDADSLARARGASLGALSRSGILIAQAGKVQLLAPDRLPADYDPATDPHITVWEVLLHLTRVLAADGIPGAAALMARVPGGVDLAIAKELAYLLFDIAETRGQTADAVAFNALAAAWNEITTASRGHSAPAAQPELDYTAVSTDDALI